MIFCYGEMYQLRQKHLMFNDILSTMNKLRKQQQQQKDQQMTKDSNQS